MLNRRFKAIAGAALAAILLAGCGSDAESPAEGSGAGPGGEPQAGGSLRIAQMTEPRTLDPAVMTNAASGNGIVGNSLFGQLLQDKEDGTFEYVLAESLTTDDGGLNWELTLRDGITYSDGTPLEADDVQFNWERIKNPALGSATLGTAALVASYRPEGLTLYFTLTQPIAAFAQAITEQSMNWIAKPEALQAGPAEFDAAPIGAGPFVLDSWQRSAEMVLKKNPSYYDSPRPYLDELRLTANGDENQRFQTVMSGGADATMSSSPAHLARGVAGGLVANVQQQNGGIPMVMNTRVAPFNDIRAREAIAAAIDLEAVNAATYDSEAQVPKTLFLEDSPVFADVPLPSYDKERAQELFDELAQEGKSVEFLITAYQTSESKRSAESFQAQLSTYDNVAVELEVLDFPAATAKYTQRNFQLMPAGFSFSGPDPFLYRNLHSTSGGNPSGISDPQLDEALQQARVATTEEERKSAYADVAERYSEVIPNVLYIRGSFAFAFDDKVGGAKLYGIGSLPTHELWMSA
jgi:peptide/nickel transport system substrate-binding protein